MKPRLFGRVLIREGDSIHLFIRLLILWLADAHAGENDGPAELAEYERSKVFKTEPSLDGIGACW